jgi:hypothetical protein
MDDEGRATFVLTLVARPSVDPIRALRGLLKVAGRQFELRCVDIRELPPMVERTQAHEINDRAITSSRRERQANSGRAGDR